MTHELAKQLKDAGWSQFKGETFYICVPCNMRTQECRCASCKDCKIESVVVPTLSELIEACGKNFFGLYLGATRWTAEEFIVGIQPRHTFGQTPEEAVAKLWLELNKK